MFKYYFVYIYIKTKKNGPRSREYIPHGVRASARNNSKEKKYLVRATRHTITRLREKRWPVGAVHLKRRIAMKVDGTIFSAGRVGNPRARASASPISAAWRVRGTDECNRPTAPSLLCLTYSLLLRLPHSLQCPRLCAHVCRA